MRQVGASTEANVVASRQGCPPSASGRTPGAFALSSNATKSSKVLGSVAPICSITALLSQIQLTEWILTGTASHLPLVVVNFCNPVGTSLAQSSLVASAVISPSLPPSA